MRRSLLALLAALTLSTGCYTTKLVVADADPDRANTHSTWQHTFFWGLVSPGSVNLSSYCGQNGIARARSQVGGIGLIAYWLTAGVWTPIQVRITCAEGPQK